MDKIESFRKLIENEVLIFDGPLLTGGFSKKKSWIFDFRRISLTGEGMDLFSDIFWDSLGNEKKIQVGGMESAAIPLIASVVMKARNRGIETSGFYIRKSRNKKGLLNKIEGILNGSEIVLIDDVLNSGNSILKQVEDIEECGYKVKKIFACVRFRELPFYSFLTKRGIEIHSIFTLEDFDIEMQKNDSVVEDHDIFKVLWAIKAENPNFHYVVPKSAPLIDDENVYFGSDSGFMWAVSQENGELIWKFKMFGGGSQGKNIFSSPCTVGNYIYFGAYDGNFYCLNKKNGSLNWVFMEADWIGSSPCVSEDLNLVFVGLEFGLINKRGGIVALNTETGKKKWQSFFEGYTHGSPSYSKKYNVVCIGSNEGFFYCFDAKNGHLKWKIQTGGEIKSSCVFDEKRGYVIFGGFSQRVFIVDVRNGDIVFNYKTSSQIFSTPAISDDFLVVTSLDKNIYCFDLKDFSVNWISETNSRIFSSPIFVENKLYLGNNSGKFMEIDIANGSVVGSIQLTERITNRAAYNSKSQRFFVPTFANEIYCLKKNETL